MVSMAKRFSSSFFKSLSARYAHISARKTFSALTVAFIPTAFLATVFMMAMGGCNMRMGMGMGSPVMQGQQAAFAFVSNSGSGTVSAFSVGTSGTLAQVGQPVVSGAGAEFMSFDSVHKLLFVSNQNASSLSVFSVNTSTGMLTPVSGSPFTVGATPHGVAVDALGKFVFVGSESGSVSGFAINGTTGMLTPVPGSPFLGISGAFGVAISSQGSILYVNNFGSNTVSAFHIDGTTGALSAVTGSPFATASSVNGPATSIGLAADSKFVFVADHMAEGVAPFSIGANGTLALPASAALPAPAAGCSVSCHNNPLRLTIDPMDRFLFATNVQAGTVSTFSIGSGGALSSVASTSTGQHPFGVTLDPTGAFLFVVNKSDSSISAFSVNSSSGMLSPVSGSPFAEGESAPTDIVVVTKTM
ncbi:MAG TPA: beta-propeller fold lactonase family protein [Candidatus Angelobacter sp.]|nr:beta-propeller fold lactonase family protein [Candidatus Angelobacter sp.]